MFRCVSQSLNPSLIHFACSCHLCVDSAVQLQIRVRDREVDMKMGNIE